MTSGRILIFLILALLTSILVSLIRAEGGITPTLERVSQFGIPTPQPKEPTPTPTPTTANPFTSGNSRFSQGRCTSDTQCKPAGCSGEVCTSGGDAVSTCEFSESFPNAQGLTCGCVDYVCGWE